MQPHPINPINAINTVSPSQVSGFEALRTHAPELAKHGAKVVLFCTAVAFFFWLARPSQRWDIQLVYSLATGLTSWLLIDGSRFFIDRASPFRFPRGWRGVALIFMGVSIGFVVGTLAGDAYSGRSTFELLPNQPRLFLYLFLFTISIGTGISYFFYTSGRRDHLVKELEISRLQATQAQLQLLQSQLEPHMLFNTLANLHALIATDPTRATQMLGSLIDYLRATLHASRATTHTLKAEFDRLDDYLTLMQVRMGTRLSYTLDLSAALAAVPVPTLLLQPLVENSIKHALEPRIEGGSLRVSARQEGADIVLEVTDNGTGVVGKQPDLHHATGFGLAHVRERLLAAYGSYSAMTLVANHQGFTCASVTFPLKP